MIKFYRLAFAFIRFDSNVQGLASKEIYFLLRYKTSPSAPAPNNAAIVEGSGMFIAETFRDCK